MVNTFGKSSKLILVPGILRAQNTWKNIYKYPLRGFQIEARDLPKF